MAWHPSRLHGVLEDRCACSDHGRVVFPAEGNSLRRDGKTALMWACENGRVESARVLVEKGANVEAQDMSAASSVFLVAP